MDPIVQALVMGVVQGLTEFLPVSSSGHLILVPALLGWHDPFITSLAFSVMLHTGTLAALLIYFRSDWIRLVPAGLATIRDRSFDGDSDRRLAWLLVVATVPALIIGLLLNDAIESRFREPGLVALTLVVGGAILWVAERNGSRRLLAVDLTFPRALGIGLAQSLALVPGISRSGISIAAGLFTGLNRESAARFSFLMATPITGAAVAYEGLKLVKGDLGVVVEVGPLLVGLAASFIFGILAITVLLRFLRTRSTDVFVAYRVLLAAVVLVWWLSLPGR
jgi:undecaprenyl-diphosphatase